MPGHARTRSRSAAGGHRPDQRAAVLHPAAPARRPAGLLERQPDVRVVGDPRADAGGDGTAELALGWQRPDVVVVDALGPPGPTPTRSAGSARCRGRRPGRGVIEPGAEIGHMVTLLRAGAQGLLFQDDPAPAGAGDPCGGRRAGVPAPAVTRRLLDSYLVTLAPPPPPEAAALAGLGPVNGRSSAWCARRSPARRSPGTC